MLIKISRESTLTQKLENLNSSLSALSTIKNESEKKDEQIESALEELRNQITKYKTESETTNTQLAKEREKFK